jgi:hypothetical protein
MWHRKINSVMQFFNEDMFSVKRTGKMNRSTDTVTDKNNKVGFTL